MHHISAALWLGTAEPCAGRDLFQEALPLSNSTAARISHISAGNEDEESVWLHRCLCDTTYFAITNRLARIFHLPPARKLVC